MSAQSSYRQRKGPANGALLGIPDARSVEARLFGDDVGGVDQQALLLLLDGHDVADDTHDDRDTGDEDVDRQVLVAGQQAEVGQQPYF